MSYGIKLGYRYKTGEVIPIMKRDAISADNTCIDFLVSTLVRFPQIFAIKYNNASKSCTFSFMYQGRLPQDKYLSLTEKIRQYFHVYGELNNDIVIEPAFRKTAFRKSTFLEVSIKGNNLNTQDINLLASTMAVELGENIISDYEEYVLNYLEDDSPEQEREVEFLSREGFQNRKKENYIVFRESGKVYVFDK